MKVVAFLQNQWFRDPERIKKIIADTVDRESEHGGRDEAGVREFYIASFLFMGCLTGKRLRSVFGEDLCNEIVWEEVSREIGGHASSVFPADLNHMRDVIGRHKPDVILAFGKLAENAIRNIRPNVNRIISGPHPTARGSDVLLRLHGMRNSLKGIS